MSVFQWKQELFLNMKFRFVFWDVLPYKIIVHRRFRGTVDDGDSMYLWSVGRQLFYTAVHPRRHTRRRENLKSHIFLNMFNRMSFEMVKCGVPTEVQTEFLNIIWKSFGFKGLIYDFSVRGCLCRRGETMSLNCSHQRACCLSPGWNMSMKSHVEVMLTRKNLRSCRKTLSQYHFSHHKSHIDWPGREPDPPYYGVTVLL
jgi:hypothetical protein